MNLAKKRCVLTVLVLVVTVYLVSGVLALGVGFSQIISVSPGETIDKVLSLQNFPADNGDLIFKGTITKGGEFVSFPEGDEVEVGGGEAGQIILRISIPESYEIGSRIPISILFETSPVSDGGSEEEQSVSFNSNIGIGFNILVVEQASETEYYEEGTAGNFWVWVIVIIILIIIIWLVMRSKKNRN